MSPRKATIHSRQNSQESTGYAGYESYTSYHAQSYERGSYTGHEGHARDAGREASWGRSSYGSRRVSRHSGDLLSMSAHCEADEAGEGREVEEDWEMYAKGSRGF